MSRQRAIGALLAGVALAAAVALLASGDPTSAPTLPKSKQVTFSVLLRLPRERDLDGLLRDLAASGAGRDTRPVSAEAFGARFGLPLGRIAQLERTLERAGLEVVARHPQRTALTVRGSPASAGRLFSIRFATRVDTDGSYRAAVGRPAVPVALRDTVVGVSGLSERPLIRPLAVPGSGLDAGAAAEAYNVVPLWRLGFRGEGQRVAVLSFYAVSENDLAIFEDSTGLSAGMVEREELLGGSAGEGLEAALSVQTIRGVAPMAEIVVFEAPYSGPEDLAAALRELLPRLARDARTKILSISYGVCDVERLSEGQLWLSPGDRLAGERELKLAAAAGISVFVAAGNQGGYECQAHNDVAARPATAWPGDSPFVVSVGGTRLSVREDGSYFEETGWDDALSMFGGGGGINRLARRPDWQCGPGIDASRARRRQVPDVAAAADPDSGFLVIFGGQPLLAGGTSAAAPYWAGIAALVRQYAQREGVRALPALGPALYRVAGDPGKFRPFHDVTRGGNRLYDAGPGWDPATGLGSPDAYELARALVADARRADSFRPTGCGP